MAYLESRVQKCVCCLQPQTSTSFSFVITYYIFQKQIKGQLTTAYFYQEPDSHRLIAE